MVIECSNCHARYNVDESKIPPAGVKVRCHKCQNIMVIQKEPAKPEPPLMPEPVQPEVPPTPDVQPPESPQEPPPLPPSEPETPPVSEPDIPEPTPPEVPEHEEPPVPPEPPPEIETPSETPSEPVPEPSPAVPDVAPPEPPEAFPPSDEPQVEVSAPVEEPPAEAAPPVELSEEDKKWNNRARRLAKALASDLVLYNQDKVEEGLRNGTLADLLGPEIRRSWEYYCQQIPKHIIESTDHFKDQLNKIVGKGKEIFK
jgi:predicted Zn finger-like uncharacterized protein